MDRPSNPKLWQSLITQARSKFHPYPSLAASHWVHSTYVKEGGQFLKSDDKRGKTGRRR